MNSYLTILLGFAILAIGVLPASGCAPRVEPTPGSADQSNETASSPDAVVAASNEEGFPDYVYRSALALKGYQIAVKERDLLSKLPCYCGCGQDSEYLNLLDCFLDPEGGFRSHGANCQVCLEEAEDAARWKSEGLSTREIRDLIDAEYEGRGPPTDTPPVTD
jgi:hypothetical protein